MVQKENKTVPAQQTTQTPTAAPKGGKTGKARNVDTRPPQVIFAERFNTEAKLMTRRFKNLASLGGAKRARPTPEQFAQVEAWLRDQVEACLADMGRKLRAQEAAPSDDKPFAILPEAPAKVANAPAPAKK